MLPVHWSPIQEVDFATVPTDGREHELHLFMEDTGWPTSSLDDYIQAWDDIYRQPLLRYADDMRAIPIDIQACFQNAHGSSLRREAMLWQYIPDPQTVAHLLDHASCRSSGGRRAPTCTTRSRSATSGRAGCCAPRPGHRSTETTCAMSADERPMCSSYVPGSTRRHGVDQARVAGVPVGERSLVEGQRDDGSAPPGRARPSRTPSAPLAAAPAGSVAAARRSTAPPRCRVAARCWSPARTRDQSSSPA